MRDPRIRQNRAGCYYFNQDGVMWGPYLSIGEARAQIYQLLAEKKTKQNRSETRAKSLHSRRTKRQQIIDENKNILVDQWRSGLFDGPVFFRKMPGPAGIMVLEPRDLCDPNCEPVMVWFGPRINHSLDNFRPMLLQDDSYYLYAYAGDVDNLAFAHQLRIHTKYILDIAEEVEDV